MCCLCAPGGGESIISYYRPDLVNEATATFTASTTEGATGHRTTELPAPGVPRMILVMDAPAARCNPGQARGRGRPLVLLPGCTDARAGLRRRSACCSARRTCEESCAAEVTAVRAAADGSGCEVPCHVNVVAESGALLPPSCFSAASAASLSCPGHTAPSPS